MCVSVNHTGLEQTVVQLFALCKLPSTIFPKWLQHAQYYTFHGIVYSHVTNSVSCIICPYSVMIIIMYTIIVYRSGCNSETGNCTGPNICTCLAGHWGSDCAQRCTCKNGVCNDGEIVATCLTTIISSNARPIISLR